MYRCTECHKEFDEYPEFCDCGNDSFEEIEDEQEETEGNEEYSTSTSVSYGYGDEELIPPSAPPAKKKRKMTPEEATEYFETQKEKKKSFIALGVIIVLCVLVFVLPPHKKHKLAKVNENVAQATAKMPSVDTFWDDSVPSAFKKSDPLANLPVLNLTFKTISPVLRDYLKDIGNEFDRKWDKSMIKPNGKKLCTTTVVFTINKEGIIDVKRVVNRSYNDSLDDSVSLALTNINSFQIPPEDYKGEKIYINFNYDENGNTYIKYPQNSNMK
ncbi:TonB C-terminal domain-containing protein [bacterium]|nr:TonB C-terminal domain-containing protein [bacterium]